MSRYLDLLKQIPPGKEEIPENLLKKLDIAACNLIISHAGQHDLSEEERQEFELDILPEVNDRKQKWGLLDKWPLQIGDLVILREKNTNFWCLGVCFGSNPPVVFECGSKEKIIEREEQLNKFRETEGEEAFAEEIMSLIDEALRYEDERSGFYY